MRAFTAWIAVMMTALLGGCPRSVAPVNGPAPAEVGAETFDACLDRVLREAGLNRYGDAPDVNYAGGTPLFDEATGETRSRRDYVQARRPELVARCVGR
jgi:hypothetical protein